MYYISILPQHIPAKTEKELEEFCRIREDYSRRRESYPLNAF